MLTRVHGARGLIQACYVSVSLSKLYVVSLHLIKFAYTYICNSDCTGAGYIVLQVNIDVRTTCAAGVIIGGVTHHRQCQLATIHVVCISICMPPRAVPSRLCIAQPLACSGGFGFHNPHGSVPVHSSSIGMTHMYDNYTYTYFELELLLQTGHGS